MKKLPPILFVFALIVHFAVLVPAQNAVVSVKTKETPEAPQKEPKTAEDFYNLARKKSISTKKDCLEAIALYDQALALNPDYAAAFHSRGYAKMSLKDYAGAIEDFNAAILIEPNERTYSLRAEAKFYLKDYQGALKDADTFVKSNLVIAYKQRGKLKYAMGDLDGALDDLKLNSMDARFLRGLVFLKKKDYASAVNEIAIVSDYYLQIIADAAKEYPELYVEKKEYPAFYNPFIKSGSKRVEAITIARVGVTVDGEPTIDNYKTLAEKLDPESWFDNINPLKDYMLVTFGDSISAMYYFYGTALEENNQMTDAAWAYTRAVIADNSNGLAHFRRGKLFMAEDKFEPAVRDFSWAIESDDKKSPEPWLERGVALLMMNRDDLAQKDFDFYLQNFPAGKETLARRIAEAKQYREKLKQNKPLTRKPTKSLKKKS